MSQKLNIIIILLILSSGILLRFYNIGFEELWYDEIISFWVANPKFTFSESFNNHNLIEINSYAYHFLLKLFFSFSNYSVESGRLLSVFFGTLAVFSTSYLTWCLTKNNSYIFSTFLTGFNIYLIGYSQEMRVYSLLFFFSSLSLIFFLKVLSKNKKFMNLIAFNIFTLINLLLHPFSLLLLFSYIFYLLLVFLKYKRLYFGLNTSLALIFIFALIFYYQSILLANDNSADYFWMTNPKLSFYTNYFFSSFFGSRLLGVIFLVTLIFLLIKNYNKILEVNYLTLLLTIIFLSYILPLIYGYLFRPVFTGRYIIFVLIPIISTISILSFYIKNRKIKFSLISFLIIVTVGNLSTEQTIKQFFNDRIPSKPEYTKALKYINSSATNFYTIKVQKMKNEKATINAINNYISEINKKNKLLTKFLPLNSISNNKIFWYICFQDINGKDCSIPKNFMNIKIIEEKNFNNINLKLIKT